MAFNSLRTDRQYPLATVGPLRCPIAQTCEAGAAPYSTATPTATELSLNFKPTRHSGSTVAKVLYLFAFINFSFTHQKHPTMYSISTLLRPLGLLAFSILSLCVYAVVTSGWMHYCLKSILSSSIDVYLRWRFPIKDTQGRRHLPTCPYEWPNGQGDVGKFLNGIENSGKWESQNGSLYRLWSGTAGEVVLTRPEQLQQVFKDSDKHSKALNNNSGWLMSQILGKCVGLISKEEWRQVRTITEVPFLHKTTTRYVSQIQQQIEVYVAGLHHSGKLGRGTLDPAQDIKMLPLFIVAKIIYGELDASLIADLRRLAPTREELFKHVIAGGLSRFSLAQYLPTTANRALQDFKLGWRDFNIKAYKKALASNTGPPIVEMYDAVHAGSITEEQLLQTLDESLYANLDVTTGAISWCIVYLASSPSTCRRLQEEFKQYTHNPDAYFLSSSTFLAACISESSRLKPLAAFSVPQSAPTERVVDGYVIPANTNFVVDSYALNIRNDYWGADATTFRPDRFLDLKSKDLRYHFWRYGFGPRQCMGKYVADLILRCLLIHLVENYDLEIPASEAEWKRDPESWITHPKMQLKCTLKGQRPT